MRRHFWVILSPVLILLDRVTKLWAAAHLSLGIPNPLLGDGIRLTRVHNVGGAFGVFPGSGELFMVVSSLIAVALVVVLSLARRLTLLLRFGLALVLAGAVGNLIDRLSYGYVLDFFEVRGFPVFNLADSCITVGAVVLVVYALWGGDRHRSHEQADRV